MRKIVGLILIIVISLAVINLTYAANNRADPVFQSLVASLTSQKDVSFSFRTFYEVPSISFSSCELQKKIGNSWQAVSSGLTPTTDFFDGFLYSGSLDCSDDIDSGQYRIKYEVTADSHSVIRYSNSRTF